MSMIISISLKVFGCRVRRPLSRAIFVNLSLTILSRWSFQVLPRLRHHLCVSVFLFLCLSVYWDVSKNFHFCTQGSNRSQHNYRAFLIFRYFGVWHANRVEPQFTTLWGCPLTLTKLICKSSCTWRGVVGLNRQNTSIWRAAVPVPIILELMQIDLHRYSPSASNSHWTVAYLYLLCSVQIDFVR